MFTVSKDELLKDPELRKNTQLVKAIQDADIYALLKVCLKLPD